MGNLFIFGMGYTASRVATALIAQGWKVRGTGRGGDCDFEDFDRVHMALDQSSHVLSSVPPEDVTGGDEVLMDFGNSIGARDRWIGYLSSTGVYGDTGGAWVDESAPTGAGRRSARADADARWLSLGARVFRLPGIYGPGRSALDRVREGRAHRIELPGQVFSRVHVDDIVAGVLAAIERDAPPGAYNLADDLPCGQNAVIEEACRLLGVACPSAISVDDAALSPEAKAFYTENRRVANGKAKRVLGWSPRYPTYREGLASLV